MKKILEKTIEYLESYIDDELMNLDMASVQDDIKSSRYIQGKIDGYKNAIDMLKYMIQQIK